VARDRRQAHGAHQSRSGQSARVRGVTSTTDVLKTIVNATGGDARRIASNSGVGVPRIVPVHSSTVYRGDDWIGLKMRDASVVRGIGVLPIFAGVFGLLLLIGSLALTWAREGR
jgi:hypothetical protein